MIALDTNILARGIVYEAEADSATQQQQQAAQPLLTSVQPVFLPLTVVQELEWALRGVYELPRNQFISLLEDLLQIEHLVVDRAAALAEAAESMYQALTRLKSHLHHHDLSDR